MSETSSLRNSWLSSAYCVEWNCFPDGAPSRSSSSLLQQLVPFFRTPIAPLKLIIGLDCVLVQVQIEPGSCAEHMAVLPFCLTFSAVAGGSHKRQQPLNKNGVYLLCADYEETAVYVVFPISGWINYAIRGVKMNSFNKGDCPRPVSELIFSSSRAWLPSNICNRRQLCLPTVV